MSEMTPEVLKAIVISFGLGVFLTCAIGMAVHIFKKKARKLIQVERERVSKVLARLVGSVNNLFFTYRLGDAEFGIMERECRELLGTIDDEIQKHSGVLDSGYVSLVSHYAEDKREQLVNIRHDLDIRRHQDAALAQQQANMAAISAGAQNNYPPNQQVQRPQAFGAPAPAPHTAQIPVSAPIMAPPVPQQGFAQPPMPPQPMYERTVQAQNPMPVYTSSINKPREDSDEGSMSFADFAAAMREEPSGQPQPVAPGDSPSSASDSWTIKSTIQSTQPHAVPAPQMFAQYAAQPPMPPAPVAAPTPPQYAPQPPMPPAPVAAPTPEVKTTMIPSQPAVAHDVEATQEFTLQDIMQQASRRTEPEDNRTGMISGDDVANKLDALFG